MADIFDCEEGAGRLWTLSTPDRKPDLRLKDAAAYLVASFGAGVATDGAWRTYSTAYLADLLGNPTKDEG